MGRSNKKPFKFTYRVMTEHAGLSYLNLFTFTVTTLSDQNQMEIKVDVDGDSQGLGIFQEPSNMAKYLLYSHPLVKEHSDHPNKIANNDYLSDSDFQINLGIIAVSYDANYRSAMPFVITINENIGKKLFTNFMAEHSVMINVSSVAPKSKAMIIVNNNFLNYLLPLSVHVEKIKQAFNCCVKSYKDSGNKFLLFEQHDDRKQTLKTLFSTIEQKLISLSELTQPYDLYDEIKTVVDAIIADVKESHKEKSLLGELTESRLASHLSLFSEELSRTMDQLEGVNERESVDRGSKRFSF